MPKDHSHNLADQLRACQAALDAAHAQLREKNNVIEMLNGRVGEAQERLAGLERQR
jgi:hypothetical protein